MRDCIQRSHSPCLWIKKKKLKNLTQLIAEPRQTKEFKSKNFVYEGSKPPKNIPQSVIDKLR